MVNQVDTEKIILKTKQYEFADGLRDIQLGLTLSLIGVVWYWLMFEPNWVGFIFRLGDKYGSWATTIVFLLVTAIPVLASLGILPIMDYIRRRWLWQASGMVKSARIVVPSYISVISTVVFIGTVGLGFALQDYLKTDELYIWSVLLIAIGWGFGVVLIGLGRYIQLHRYVYMGVFGGIASTLLIFIQDSLTRPGLLFFVGWGILLLISGSIVLKQAWPEVKEESHVG